MYLYRIQIVIMADKVDEFAGTLRAQWFKFLREDGCFNYKVYKEFDKENSFCLVGEYDNRDSMENHFQTSGFEILIGAAGVLSESFKIHLSENFKNGDLKLAKSLRKNKQ